MDQSIFNCILLSRVDFYLNSSNYIEFDRIFSEFLNLRPHIFFSSGYYNGIAWEHSKNEKKCKNCFYPRKYIGKKRNRHFAGIFFFFFLVNVIHANKYNCSHRNINSKQRYKRNNAERERNRNEKPTRTHTFIHNNKCVTSIVAATI